VEKIRQDLDLPRSHQSALLIKSEVKKLQRFAATVSRQQLLVIPNLGRLLPSFRLERALVD
jgi:hypothetical protein